MVEADWGEKKQVREDEMDGWRVESTMVGEWGWETRGCARCGSWQSPKLAVFDTEAVTGGLDRCVGISRLFWGCLSGQKCVASAGFLVFRGFRFVWALLVASFSSKGKHTLLTS